MIPLDLGKVYDNVNWLFMRELMIYMGFSEQMPSFTYILCVRGQGRACHAQWRNKTTHPMLEIGQTRMSIEFLIVCNCNTSHFNKVSLFSNVARGDILLHNVALHLPFTTKAFMWRAMIRGFYPLEIPQESGMLLVEFLLEQNRRHFITCSQQQLFDDK